MAIIYFHELPIYRLSPEAYDKELRELTHKIVDDPPGTLLPTTEASQASARAGLLDHYYRHFGPWRFNEITGYVRLALVHRRVVGFGVGRRVRQTGPRFGEPIFREVRSRTKVFVESPKLAEGIVLPTEATNSACLEIIHAYVAACRKALPRRYFDDHWLAAVGMYVDWQKLSDSSDL